MASIMTSPATTRINAPPSVLSKSAPSRSKPTAMPSRSAADTLRAFQPDWQEGAEASPDKALVPVSERRQHCRQHPVDGPLASRFDPHGSREVPYRRREAGLVDVQADPENDVIECAVARGHGLRQQAADFPLPDHDVVGPADRGRHP